MRFLRFVALFLGAAVLSGCSTLMFWKNDEPPPPAAADAAKPDAAGEAKAVKTGGLTDEQELKLAKLWSRVDELEEEQFRQKERVRVLEKGLTLGLMPEELKHPEKVKPAAEPKSKSKKDKPHAAETPKDEPKDAAVAEAAVEPVAAEPAGGEAPPADKGGKKAEVTGLSKADSEKYQTLLANAHDHYRAGRYGRAIVDYSEIGKQFGDKAGGGMHLYWIAKCWSNLKEYNTARQHLVDFLKDNAGSPWAPRAKLELAKVEWSLGMQETALQRFREVIQEHPYEDAAEMAKMELENLDKKL